MRETWVRSLRWEDPLEEGMVTHSSILAWRIPMDRGAWQATVHGVVKSWASLSDWAHTSTQLIRKNYSMKFWAESTHTNTHTFTGACIHKYICPLDYGKKYFLLWSEVKWNHSVMSNSLWPCGLWPTRLRHPWDFPSKNTGVGCHFLLRLIGRYCPKKFENQCTRPYDFF